MSWGLIGSTALVVGGNLLAGGSAGRAQERAAETQAEAAERAGQQQLALGREQLAATAPLRQLALEQGQLGLESQRAILPLLRQEFETGAGLAPFFQQQLERGTTGTISALAPFGLEESSVAGRAVGELGAGLGTQELLARRNLGLQLAGLGQVPGGFATAGLGTSALLQQGGIQSQFAAGQSRAAGQLGAGLSQAAGIAGAAGGLSNLFSSPKFQNVLDLFKGTGTPISLAGAQPIGFQGPVGPGGGFFGIPKQ